MTVERIVELVESGNGCDVAVGASGVAHISHTIIHSEIGAHFPGVAEIPRQPVIRSFAASRKPERWKFRSETLAVAKSYAVRRVVQRIVCASGKWAIGRGNARRGAAGCAHRRCDRQETGKSAAVKMVKPDTETKDVTAVGRASVVLDLMVRLHGGLRRKEIRAGAEVIRSRSEAEGIATNG